MGDVEHNSDELEQVKKHVESDQTSNACWAVNTIVCNANGFGVVGLPFVPSPAKHLAVSKSRTSYMIFLERKYAREL